MSGSKILLHHKANQHSFGMKKTGEQGQILEHQHCKSSGVVLAMTMAQGNQQSPQQRSQPGPGTNSNSRKSANLFGSKARSRDMAR